jgi:serine/threonine-protein kinase
LAREFRGHLQYDGRVGTESREGALIGGKYQLERRIGQGAMGDVYRARNLDVGRVVAIKLLSASLANDDVAVKRFLREARAASLVRHPNVVDVIDLGQDSEGVPFIVQDYLSGSDLRDHVSSLGGSLPPRDALALLRPIAHALAAAHERGVVHRDVKPGNIFLAMERGACIPKLVDFGISRIAAPDQTATMAGQIVGTPAYMAPEQILKPDAIGPATDVWAFGVVLFECLAGRRPFDEPTVAGLYVAISQAPIPRLDELRFDVPAELSDLVARCLERDLARRLPDGAALAAALDAPELMAAVSRPPPAARLAELAFAQATTARPAGPADHTVVDPAIPAPAPIPIEPIPELDLPRRSRPDMRAATPLPSSSPMLAAAPPPSGRPTPPLSSASMPAAGPASVRMSPTPRAPAPPPAGPGQGASFDSEPPPAAQLELDVAPSSASAPWRRAALHGQKPKPAASKEATGERAGVAHVVLSIARARALAGGAGAALLRFVHRPAGLSLKSALPSAFDGTSGPTAGVVALSAVVLTVAIGALGLRAPRSYAMLFAAFGNLLVAMVMIVVTFSTTPSETPTPPEAGIIVPFVVPLVPLGLAAWALGYARRQWLEGGARRALLVLFAVVSGALGFLAFEVSPATHLFPW